jgi:predicted RNase H-related nuclease YkuK (DUF458 family)
MSISVFIVLKQLIMQEQLLFSKLSSNVKVDLCMYINEYMEQHPDTEIMIGCDSQNYAESTIYAVVVALYKKGKGAHLLYRRWKTSKEYTRSTRLLTEVWNAIETAELMRGSGLPKPIWIDVDLNPDQRYKSNEVFRQAIGMVEGMGYKVRYKSMGPMVTYAADHLIKT